MARLALVTGASSGIGEEFARQLAERGYDLILTARRKDRLAHLAEEIEKAHSVSTEVIPADLTLAGDLATLENRLRESREIEILVNNAGFGLAGDFLTHPVEEHLGMVEVHIQATLRLTHAALSPMLERERGYIINVSSIAAFIQSSGNPGYSASKAYLNSFSSNLHSQTAPRGVHLQALCPGYTRTEFHTRPDYSGDESEKLPDWVWMETSEVVAYSLEKLDSGRVVVIPGLKNRLVAFLLRSFLGRAMMSFRDRFLKK